MQTRMLMSTSAVIMGVLGLGASFLPQEFLLFVGYRDERLPVVLIQIIGGLYLGFGFLNWMARGVLIGGIYGRPLVMGNFMHFAVVAIVLAKLLMDHATPLVLLYAATYSVVAVWFGFVLFTHPGGGDYLKR